MLRYKKIFVGASLGISVGLTAYYKLKNNSERKYTYEDILKHNNYDNRIWTTYKNNVYDITDFVNSHPGGKDKIMLAAGKSIDPYWKVYKQHTNDPNIVNQILEPMKIGTIKDYDPNKYNDTKDPYINDPIRDHELNFHNVSPCNAETPVEYLIDTWITPNEFWYIRNHHPVPDINIDNYELNVNNKSYNIDDLKKMKSKKIVTTIQCGGNRRKELNEIEKTSGTLWNYGAISTAEWKGVLLRDILISSGIKDDDILNNKINHIHFEGDEGVISSIPAEKAMNVYGDVLLAYEMNGDELPRDHGYPLRLIVPGHVGIRNIKWLKNIKVSNEEAEGTWQRGISYKGLPHYIKDVKKINIDKIAAIQELPVQSCIVNVSEENDFLKIKGFAWSGGGRGIIRVDVSCDGGKTWNMAELKEGSEQKLNKAWAWTLWELNLNNNKIVLQKDKEIKICCKATDSSYNVQPEKRELAWNIRGLNNNSWHTILFKQ